MTDIEKAEVVTYVRPRYFSWRSYFVTMGILTAVFTPPIAYFFLSDEIQRAEFGTAGAIGIAILIGGFSAFFYGSLFYFPILAIRRWTSKAEERVERLAKSSEDLQGALEQDFVTTLVKINFKFIDQYYLQTRIQADKSFIVTVAAAAVSLMLIFIGIGLMYFGGLSATPATAGATVLSAGGAAATLSAAAGILGQFISAVFFYLYNQTVAKMADYHRKLVFTQNIGLALKISDDLPTEQKTKAQLALIETLSKDINQYLSV